MSHSAVSWPVLGHWLISLGARCAREQDKSGSINYHEFKRVWAHFSNVRQELLNRKVPFPKWAPHFKLVKILEQCLEEEERREVRVVRRLALLLHAALKL